MRTLQFIVISLLLGMFAASARAMTADTVYMYTSDVLRPQTAVMPAWPDTTSLALFNAANRHAPINIYRMPYSLDASSPDWHRMWINTAVLSGAFVSTLFVLAIQTLVPQRIQARSGMGPRQPDIQLRAASLCRRRLLHVGTHARLQFLAVDALLGLYLHHWLGVRHRSLHGASVVPGYRGHAGSRFDNRRAVLQTQAQHSEPRLPSGGLAGAWQHSGVSHRPRQRGPWSFQGQQRPQTPSWAGQTRLWHRVVAYARPGGQRLRLHLQLPLLEAEHCDTNTRT